MKTLLLGAASVLMPGKKAKVVIVGLQFAVLAYQLLKKEDNEADRISSR